MGSSNLLKPSSTDEMLMIFIHCPNIHSPLFAPLEDQDGKLFKPWTVATLHFYAFPRDNSPVALILIGWWCWVVISNNLELCNICSLRRQIGTDSMNMETTLESSSWMQAASFWSFKSWSLIEKRLDQALFLLASSLLSGAGRLPIGWDCYCVPHRATSSGIRGLRGVWQTFFEAIVQLCISIEFK